MSNALLIKISYNNKEIKYCVGSMKKIDILLKLFSSPRVHLINSDVQKIFPLNF